MARPYDIGTKLALMDMNVPLNVYPGVPRQPTLVGPDADPNFDSLREHIRSRNIDLGFQTFDRKTGIGSENLSDLNAAPVSDGGSP